MDIPRPVAMTMMCKENKHICILALLQSPDAYDILPFRQVVPSLQPMAASDPLPIQVFPYQLPVLEPLPTLVKSDTTT